MSLSPRHEVHLKARKIERCSLGDHSRLVPNRCDRGGRRSGNGLHSRLPTILQQLAALGADGITQRFRQQVAALCFRRVDAAIEVLLVTSRGSGRWIIPKGWPIKGKAHSEAALTEAREEAGVNGVADMVPVGRYTYLKELADGKVVPCCVDVYPVEVTSVADNFKERDQRRFDWVDPLEAARRVREIELKSLLANFRPRTRSATRNK